MNQWGNYGISQVHYNSDRSHVEAVLVHAIGENVGPGQSQKRAWVVNELAKGMRFTTMVKTADGKWTVGARVTEFEHPVKFIKLRPTRVRGTTLAACRNSSSVAVWTEPATVGSWGLDRDSAIDGKPACRAWGTDLGETRGQPDRVHGSRYFAPRPGLPETCLHGAAPLGTGTSSACRIKNAARVPARLTDRAACARLPPRKSGPCPCASPVFVRCDPRF
jgi:hypothetical protein